MTFVVPRQVVEGRGLGGVAVLAGRQIALFIWFVDTIRKAYSLGLGIARSGFPRARRECDHVIVGIVEGALVGVFVYMTAVHDRKDRHRDHDGTFGMLMVVSLEADVRLEQNLLIGRGAIRR